MISYFFLVLAGQIGIIGGSGMNDPDIFKERKEKYVTTPYGEVFCFIHNCTTFGYQFLPSPDNCKSLQFNLLKFRMVIKKWKIDFRKIYRNLG